MDGIVENASGSIESGWRWSQGRSLSFPASAVCAECFERGVSLAARMNVLVPGFSPFEMSHRWWSYGAQRANRKGCAVDPQTGDHCTRYSRLVYVN